MPKKFDGVVPVMIGEMIPVGHEAGQASYLFFLPVTFFAHLVSRGHEIPKGQIGINGAIYLVFKFC